MKYSRDDHSTYDIPDGWKVVKVTETLSVWDTPEDKNAGKLPRIIRKERFLSLKEALAFSKDEKALVKEAEIMMGPGIEEPKYLR
jgi:hypothetical protein